MRIIAGTRRGCPIAAPKGRDTRPTLDRVKEAVFGIIQFEIEERRVLDLFAGSGNLALEALSRGAKAAVLVDRARGCEAVIRANIAKLRFDDLAEVYAMDFMAAISRFALEKREFDLVFLDPPYGAGLVDEAMARLLEADVLSDGAILVTEHAAKLPPKMVEGFSLRLTRAYGDTAISIFTFGEGRV